MVSCGGKGSMCNGVEKHAVFVDKQLCVMIVADSWGCRIWHLIACCILDSPDLAKKEEKWLLILCFRGNSS